MKHFLHAFVAALLLCGPGVAEAEIIRTPSRLSVDDAVAEMTAAIAEAGARVFATVNFQDGSAKIGQDLRPTTLIIFGSPKIGGEALQVGQTMALHLPLKLLAHEDENGRVWLSYADPVSLAVENGIPADHPGVLKMRAALEALTATVEGAGS